MHNPCGVSGLFVAALPLSGRAANPSLQLMRSLLRASLLGIVLLLPLSLIAANNRRDAAREAAIEQQLAKLDPTLVEPFHQARTALDTNNFAEAERLLAPICAKLPRFDPALRRLGSAIVMQKRRAEGLGWIEKAIAINRSSANLVNLAYALGFTPDATNADRDRALQAVLEARALPDGDDSDVLSMIAQLTLQRDRYVEARAAIGDLLRLHPDLMASHYFAAWLAVHDESWNRAVREIRRAEKLGLDHNTVQQFLNNGVQSRATAWFVGGVALWTVGLWIVGLLSLCGLGFLLSRATLRQIERSDPSIPVTPAEHRLRRIYRTVLNLAGAYYYISLPVVFVLVLAAAAAVFYGFFALGRLPIKLLLIVGIGAIATIVAMIRSLFLKVKATDPGRALTREEAPKLWELTEDVAQTLQTHPIDEIRVTVGTDLCVYERGTWREKMDNRAKRILVIGAAVLDGFKLDEFRSVLAHEYGHFSNRDTAGGDVAMRVQNDMIKFYVAMVKAGQATWINIGFHFLRAYNFIFRRISHGATRLQEVLADRVAAQHYGALAFEGGLRHVIRQSVEFHARADHEIQTALKAKRPIQNLYDSALPLGRSVDDELHKVLNRTTTDDDTHPAPLDRFRLVAKVPAPNRAASSGMVWDLFTDRQALTTELTQNVEKNIASHRN